MEVDTLKCTWKIKNYSKVQTEILYSDVFSYGPYKWNMYADPKGYSIEDHLSVNLMVADSATFPCGWSRKAKFTFTLINQIDNRLSITKGLEYEFKENAISAVLPSIISHKELCDPGNGYLLEDMCIIEVDVTIYDNASDDSHCPSKLEVNEEDIDAFFVDLNSVIFPKKIISSEEEAKQALELIEDAFNMVPSDLNNPGRISELTNAFEVLSSLDDCSLLTSEQKAELVGMKDNFIVLSERAEQAVRDKKLFTEKELVKKTLDHKLGRCLVSFVKAKAEAIQNKQDIAILQQQIAEKKRREEDSTSMQKQLFKQSKELKAELDVLLKHWPVYEAKMNAAEEEEKVIGKQWTKMKQSIISLKKPFYSSLKPNCTLAKKPVKRSKWYQRVLKLTPSLCDFFFQK